LSKSGCLQPRARGLQKAFWSPAAAAHSLWCRPLHLLLHSLQRLHRRHRWASACVFESLRTCAGRRCSPRRGPCRNRRSGSRQPPVAWIERDERDEREMRER
jgi:hypothetical protein